MPHGAVPFPFGHCRICNDKATGFHYGVATCEGCKGFFKRSIPKGDKYTCFFGGQCDITPFNRNRCKACRFKRCLDNGMAIDAVKMGRIPQVEKERALHEASLQTKPQESMDVDTEETVSNVKLSHSKWIDSDLRQEPHELRVVNDDFCREESMGLNLAASRCMESDTISSRAHILPAQEWGNTEMRGLSLKFNSELPVFESRDSGLCSSDACLQRQAHTWSSGSVRAHIDTLLEKSNSVNEKNGTLSALPLSSSSAASYENLFCSQSEKESWDDLSHNSQLVAGLGSHPRGQIITPKHSKNSAHSSFIGTSPTKVEHEIKSYNSVCDKRTIHCENPFTEPSIGYGYQGLKSRSYPTPLADMALVKIFDRKSVNFPNQAGVEREFCLEELTGEMNTEASMTQHGCSCESFEYNKSAKDEVHMSNISRKDSKHVKTNDYRNSCYSSDVIKVLMDQVGDERIKGMTQHIMTTIAKTFGPDEYEATAKLLTSYTHSNEQLNNIKPHFLQQPHNNGKQHCSSVSECSESFVFEPSLSDSTHHTLQEVLSLPSCSALNLSTHCQNDINILATSSRHALAEHSQDCITIPPTLQGLSAENSSRLSYSFNVHQESHLLEHDRNMKSSNASISVQYSGTSLENKDFEFQDVDSFRDDHTRNRLKGSFTCNVSSAATSSGQFLTEDYDTDIVRCSDKVSVSSHSQNSNSDKDIGSPDSSNFDDLTMAESALILRAAYEKHMKKIGQHYKRMIDFIQNKKVIPFHPLTLEGKAKVYSNLIASIPDINKRIIGFSQDVPGFVSLPKEDREILMKRGYYDIWMLTNSKLFYGDESYLQFDDGTFYTRALMEFILNASIAQKFIAFAKKFNDLALSNLETAILCAIQLTSHSHEQLDLKSHESIQQINSHFVDLLAHEISKQHPSNCSRILMDIFRLMPDLSEINMMQQEIIANFSTSKPPEKVEYTPKAVPMADISDTDLATFPDDS